MKIKHYILKQLDKLPILKIKHYILKQLDKLPKVKIKHCRAFEKNSIQTFNVQDFWKPREENRIHVRSVTMWVRRKMKLKGHMNTQTFSNVSRNLFLYSHINLMRLKSYIILVLRFYSSQAMRIWIMSFFTIPFIYWA